MSGVVQVSDPALRLLCSIECSLVVLILFFFMIQCSSTFQVKLMLDLHCHW